MSWLSIIYFCILSIGVVTYGTYTLYPLGNLRAILYAIGSILLFIFFGFRWFSSVAPSTNWPPTINMCPDYLTYVPKITGASSVSGGACVDLLGVTKSSSGLQMSDPSTLSSLTSTDTARVFEYTAADVKGGNSTTLQKICNRCQQTGLTWEGVYDGDVCQGINRVSMNTQCS